MRRHASLLLAIWALPVFAAPAANTKHDLQTAGVPLTVAAPDPAIAKVLAQISPEHIHRTIETLVGFGNRNTLGGMEGHKPNTGVLEAADWIESEFKRYSEACGGCLEIKRDSYVEAPGSRVPKPTTMQNIYAILRGTDPAQASRMNLVTGHYDSRNTNVLDTEGAAPGANDDASGTAVSLECARVLSQGKWPSTLVFAAVVGEEQGLNGSRHLAQLAKKEGWQLESDLNNDIVGGNTTPGDDAQDKNAIRIFSEGIPSGWTPDQVKRMVALGAENDSPSREIARAVADVARTYTSGSNADNLKVFLEFRRDRYGRSGDHTSFNHEGFAAVRFTEWREDYNHQHQNVRTENGIEYGDFLKYVDFAYVAKVARLNAAVLATEASAPGIPQHVRLGTTKQENSSSLAWEAPPGAPAGTHYQVVWRETAAADWQYSADAGTATALTVPASKDNVVFGVRALDAMGHASPAASPE